MLATSEATLVQLDTRMSWLSTSENPFHQPQKRIIHYDMTFKVPLLISQGLKSPNTNPGSSWNRHYQWWHWSQSDELLFELFIQVGPFFHCCYRADQRMKLSRYSRILETNHLQIWSLRLRHYKYINVFLLLHRSPAHKSAILLSSKNGSKDCLSSWHCETIFRLFCCFSHLLPCMTRTEFMSTRPAYAGIKYYIGFFNCSLCFLYIYFFIKYKAEEL